jgi:hypothetical protein
VQGFQVHVFARSAWRNGPPHQFTIWEKAFCDRIARPLRLRHPTHYLLVSEAERAKNPSTSDEWTVAPPEFPGQAQYYFEDEEKPKKNRSGLISVSTKEFAVDYRGVAVGGDVARVEEGTVTVEIPVRVRREVKTDHRMGATVDPEVTVLLLVPWGEGERDLRQAVLTWVESQGLTDDLLAAAAERGAVGAAPVDALETISDGFLSPDPAGWEIGLGNETRFTVGPETSQSIAVSIRPPGRGRMSYALKVVDSADPSRYVIGPVVELEATRTKLRISEGSLDPTWRDVVAGVARWLGDRLKSASPRAKVPSTSGSR